MCHVGRLRYCLIRMYYSFLLNGHIMRSYNNISDLFVAQNVAFTATKKMEFAHLLHAGRVININRTILTNKYNMSIEYETPES